MTHIVNNSGSVVAAYTYDTWGKLISIKNGSGTDITNNTTSLGYINPIRYRGYYYDNETGFYYLQSRYYDPTNGRFINADSQLNIGDGPLGCNLFTYCENDPVNYADSDGHSVICAIIIGAIIGAVVGFGVVAYVDYKDDGEVFNGSVKWYSYVGVTVAGAALGAFLGPGISEFAGTTFSTSIPTLGLINSGGVAAIGVTGAITISVTGSQILTGTAIGVAILFSKGYGPRMGHNGYENKQFRDLSKKHHLTEKEQEILHDEISHKNYSYREIEQLIFDLFGK